MMKQYKRTNNLTGKCIIEFTNLNHLQQYINLFEIEYKIFECKPQRHQLKNTIPFTMEEVFETL